MNIRVLEDNVVNQIAAGEVVERPASVVRELVDNAIDAGASELNIWIEAGGKTLIRVVDNGHGMERDDALLAFERHATSKLRNDKDLAHIATLGFRGEALSSIAAVSQAKLRTKTKDAAAATELIFHGGKMKGVNDSSGPSGTEVEIRRLFYNTPARKKFLKLPKTEEQRIKQWLKQSAIAHPHVRYRLYADGREIVNLPRRDSCVQRAEDIFKGSMVEIAGDTNGIKLSGLIAHPSMAQASLKSFVLLVNKRVVSDPMLIRALREGFDSTLKAREYPMGFLSIETAPEMVDVNVHPQKSEVRFRDSRAVFEVVSCAVLDAVRSFKAPVSNYFEKSEQDFYQANYSKSSSSYQSSEPFSSNAWSGQAQSLYKSAPSVAPGTYIQSEDDFCFSDLHYIGQALKCYLFCEKDGAVYVVDMHAAHERYNYNLIRNSYHDRKIDSQQLLMPLMVELNEAGLASCLSNIDCFERFGFEIEAFGDTTLAVRSIPSLLIDKDITALIKEIAGLDLEESAEGKFKEMIDHIAARIACHASVRSGKKIEREEVYSLFELLDKSEFSSACPHGRPVVVSFSEFEVEKWFGRDR